jgi:hypothetical protein
MGNWWMKVEHVFSHPLTIFCIEMLSNEQEYGKNISETNAMFRQQCGSTQYSKIDTMFYKQCGYFLK